MQVGAFQKLKVKFDAQGVAWKKIIESKSLGTPNLRREDEVKVNFWGHLEGQNAL